MGATRCRGEHPWGTAPQATMDLAIVATANVHKVPLLTENVRDFQIISELVDVRSPSRAVAEAPPADSLRTVGHRRAQSL